MQAGRVCRCARAARRSTLIVVAADHGESFGEHGEIGHSMFIYDTTLRVPLILSGAGPAARTNGSRIAVALIDVAPTVLRLLGVKPFDADGVDLGPLIAGEPLARARTLRRVVRAAARLRVEPAPGSSLAWMEVHRRSPSRALRHRRGRRMKRAIAAAGRRHASPKCTHGLPRNRRRRRWREIDRDARARLQALGYAGGSPSAASGSRPDPKDRRDEAARLARVTSGELQGAALERALRADSRRRQAQSASEPAARVRTARQRPLPRGGRTFSRRRSLNISHQPTPTSGSRRARSQRAASSRPHRRCATPNGSSPTTRSSSPISGWCCRTAGTRQTRSRPCSGR